MNRNIFFKKSLNFSLLFCLMFFFACNNAGNSNKEEAMEETPKEAMAEMTWKTDTVFTGSESTLFDPVSETIFVSNGNTKSSEKDGDGYISKIKPDGSVVELKWVENLDAPKGMAILNGKLYVSDIDKIIAINLNDGEIAQSVTVDSAKFLNDVCTDGEKIFFSDMRAAKVYQLEGETYSVIAENVPNINGLEHHDGVLYGLNKEGLLKFDGNGSYAILNDEVLGGDGLVILNDSTFIASRWAGQIFYIEGDKTTLLVDTQEEKSNTADITYVPEQNLIIVPTFLKNEVAAYKLSFH